MLQQYISREIFTLCCIPALHLEKHKRFPFENAAVYAKMLMTVEYRANTETY